MPGGQRRGRADQRAVEGLLTCMVASVAAVRTNEPFRARCRPPR